MSDTANLFLTEEMMLLALRDREGTVATGAWYHQAVAGAILAELVLRGRIAVADPRAPLAVVDKAPIGDPVIDECLALMADAERPRKPAHWFHRFSQRELPHRVAAGLVRRAILRADEDKVLLIFTRRIYPEVDPEPERELVDRLRAAVFEDEADPDACTVVLVSLAHHTGLLAVNFGRAEVKARRAHIERLVSGEATGELAREAIQAAIVVAAILPGVIVATT